MKRYQSLTKNGEVIKQGHTIESVSGFGERIIVDYKQKRFAVQPVFPPTFLEWFAGTSNVGNIIRAQG